MLTARSTASLHIYYGLTALDVQRLRLAHIGTTSNQVITQRLRR
ncbi:MAG: hypothetical protein WCL57_13065 [Chloroflexota bacterium]